MQCEKRLFVFSSNGPLLMAGASDYSGTLAYLAACVLLPGAMLGCSYPEGSYSYIWPICAAELWWRVKADTLYLSMYL